MGYQNITSMKMFLSLVLSGLFGLSLSGEPLFHKNIIDAYLAKPKVQKKNSIVDSLDPFEPYLFTLPEEVKWQSTYTIDSVGIKIDRMTFKSKDQINTVYGIIVSPVLEGVYPAILVLHGGRGNAEGELNRLKEFAEAGYVAMAIDLPGLSNVGNTPYSTGPWKQLPLNEKPRFNVVGGAKNSTLTDCAVAAIGAFNFISTQPNVNKERVGITGLSWGGYTTTLLAGLLKERVKAVYAIYGSGFFDKGSIWESTLDSLPENEKEIWLTYLDPGRRASSITASYFIEAASNDIYFLPTSIVSTLNKISGNKNQIWGANLNHSRVKNGEYMQISYFDYYLKGIGMPFHRVRVKSIPKNVQEKTKFEISIEGRELKDIISVTLYYSEANVDWPIRVWNALDAKVDAKGNFVAFIPSDFVGDHINYYASAIDSQGVEVSSIIY